MDTNNYLELPPRKELEFFFLLKPFIPFSSYPQESLALLASWLFEKKKKGNCREGLVALGQSSSETFSTVVLSISTAIQSSYGKTLVFMQTSGRTLSCGMD
jgi:hypothetical protein